MMALSPLLFKEKLTALKIAGFLSVLIGVFLINGNALTSDSDNFGIICGLRLFGAALGGIILGHIFKGNDVAAADHRSCFDIRRRTV